MSDDLLKNLSEAANDDEREWLVTKDLLDSLPENLQRVAYAASIPHWFDSKVLSALCPDLTEQIENLLEQLSHLPFVESFKDRGFNIHEKTRKLILDHFWVEDQDKYIAVSKAAENYFDNAIKASSEIANNQIKKLKDEIKEEDILQQKIQEWIDNNRKALQGFDPQYQIERIYHLVIADPEQGADAIWQQGVEWHDEFDYTYATLTSFIKAIHEHIDNGRVKDRAKYWVLYWEGVVASKQYQYLNAKKIFNHLMSFVSKDNRLWAMANEDLGDVHNQLSELPEARARYEEALPLYRAIGAKIGEANCIKALGDVHNKLSELPEARARYEEALPLYRAIGEKIGEMYTILNLADVASKEKKFDLAIQLAESTIETAKKISPSNVASAFNNLANIYEKKKDYPKAIEFYTKAMEIFTGSQAYMIRNRANVYLKMADAENAEKDIVRAEQIQPNNPFLFLRKGELANLKGNFEEAIIFFMKAIDIIPRFSGAFFGIGMSNLRAGKIQEAKISYQQGLSFTDAVDELEDTIEELEKLKSRQPSLLGVDDILEMLKTWKPDKK